jgi:3-isopropylmalate/(R)-2-methylmalate dehydratase large subunit
VNTVEKILSAKSGGGAVAPGDIVVCDVDRIVHLDISFLVPGMDQVPRRIAAPERTVVIMDHAIPAPTPQYATSHRAARELAARFGLRIHDVGDHGICHQVTVDLLAAQVHNDDRGVTLPARPIPPFLLATMRSGGVLEQLRKEGFLE